MPVLIDSNIPSAKFLLKEKANILNTSNQHDTASQLIKIAIVNLMPSKFETEIHFLRIFENIPLNINIEFIQVETHKAKNISTDYLSTYYKTLTQIKDQRFDGMIITGAPVECLEFEDVDYWNELKQIMDFSKSKVNSTIYICWAAQAGLYYHYGIRKKILKEKIFGVFMHTISNKNIKLFKGFDDEFFVPHSRHSEIIKNDIEMVSELEILSESKDSGIYIVASKDRKQFFITGHSEYDALTLKKEYERDKEKGLVIKIPYNYFLNDDPTKEPIVKWRAHSKLLFLNWLYGYVAK